MAVKLNRDDETSINLTPLIDIVFLLVIFVMVGARFSELSEMEKQLPLQVPQVSDASAMTDAPRNRVINVLKDGTVMLDKQVHTVQSLYQEMAESTGQYKKLGVVIRADADCRHQNVADVIAACRKANVAHLNLSVKTVQLR